MKSSDIQFFILSLSLFAFSLSTSPGTFFPLTTTPKNFKHTAIDVQQEVDSNNGQSERIANLGKSKYGDAGMGYASQRAGNHLQRGD